MSASKQSCRHHDIQIFDGFRCCLACGEAVFNHVTDASNNTDLLPSGRYCYSQLNYRLGQEIRLLELFPAEEAGQADTDELQCNIIHVNLADKPVYEALSYTWATPDGDSSLSKSIMCREIGRSIAVTTSCEAALRHLRLRGRNRTLWVDAICIDQDNVSERSHQVNFMSTIYSSASQVLMFLGPGSAATDRVMNFINGLHPASVWNNTEQRMDDIRQFLRLRYFDRVWVLQEIALARLTTVIVGDKTAHWTAKTTKDLKRQFSGGWFVLPSALRWHPGSELEEDLLEVLGKSRNSSASDQRDKVYAVLGLVQPHIIKNFVVDYSLPVEEVFVTVGEHIIKEQHCLNLLKHVANISGRFDTEGLPTWVPRWDVKTDYDPLPAQFSTSETLSLSQSWSLPPSFLNRVLTYDNILDCGIVDDGPGPWVTRSTAWWYTRLVQTLKRGHPGKANYDQISPRGLSLYMSYKWDRDFHYEIHRCAPVIQTAHDMSLLRTLRVKAHYLDEISGIYTSACDELSGDFYTDPKYHLQTVPAAFGSTIRCFLCSEDGDHRVPIPCTSCFMKRQSHPVAYKEKLHRAFLPFRRESRFVTTKSAGALPVGSARAKDTIWAIDGADVSFVLRREFRHYILIGACYLYGATKSLPCGCCGRDAQPWPMVTRIIDIL